MEVPYGCEAGWPRNWPVWSPERPRTTCLYYLARQAAPNLDFRRDVFNRAAVDAGLGEWIDGPKRPYLQRRPSPRTAPHRRQPGREGGTKVSAVQKMLGHSSAKMTLDTYTHLFDDELEGVAERFARPPPRHQTGTRSTAEVVDLKKRRTTR